MPPTMPTAEGRATTPAPQGPHRVLWVAVALVAASIPVVVLALVGLPHVFRNPLVGSGSKVTHYPHLPRGIGV